MRITFLICCFILLIAPSATAQKAHPLVMALTDTIASKHLGEDRVLNIYLPQNYEKEKAASYSVIYLLDGSAHEDFPHIAGLVQFFHMYELMPTAILVGIANVDRYRDFTTPTQIKKEQKGIPNAGGADKFIAFMEDEVQPYMQKHFQVEGEKTLIGQSLGGLMAAETLFRKPHLFDNYLIVSPSLWWNDQELLKRADAFLAAHPDLKKKVYLALGTEGPEMKDGMDKLLAAFEKAGNDQLEVHFEPFPKEFHATILHRAVYRGFEVLFEGKDWTGQ